MELNPRYCFEHVQHKRSLTHSADIVGYQSAYLAGCALRERMQWNVGFLIKKLTRRRLHMQDKIHAWPGWIPRHRAPADRRFLRCGVAILLTRKIVLASVLAVDRTLLRPK
jgi:hypothetical protein